MRGVSRRLGTVVLDCAEPSTLAAFWSAVLELPVTEKSDEWWELAAMDGGMALAFQRVARHRAPGRGRPQQLHLDIAVDDLDAAEDLVLSLGAIARSDRKTGGGKPWRVYADPAGHPFCLCTCRSTA
jgi:glyoxalase superfamily protein